MCLLMLDLRSRIDQSIDCSWFFILVLFLRLMSQSMRDLLQCDVTFVHNINFSSWISQNEAQEPIITKGLLSVHNRSTIDYDYCYSLNILKYFSQKESQIALCCTTKLLERHLNLCLADFDSILFWDQDVT